MEIFDSIAFNMFLMEFYHASYVKIPARINQNRAILTTFH